MGQTCPHSMGEGERVQHLVYDRQTGYTAPMLLPCCLLTVFFHLLPPPVPPSFSVLTACPPPLKSSWHRPSRFFSWAVLAVAVLPTPSTAGHAEEQTLALRDGYLWSSSAILSPATWGSHCAEPGSWLWTALLRQNIWKFGRRRKSLWTCEKSYSTASWSQRSLTLIPQFSHNVEGLCSGEHKKIHCKQAMLLELQTPIPGHF